MWFLIQLFLVFNEHNFLSKRVFLIVVESFFDIVYVERMIGGVEKLFFVRICVLNTSRRKCVCEKLI